jgi:putative ABC transport system permease protein
MLISMAWRNLWRHRRRTLLTALAMGVSVAFVMALITFSDGMYRKMSVVLIDETTGHVQVHHPDYTRTRASFASIADAAARVKAVEALANTRVVVPRLFGNALVGGATETTGVQLIGVDPAREPLLTPDQETVRVGRWLGPAPAREIVLGAGLAESLEAAIGSEVVAVTQASDGSLGNELYRVVGIRTSGSATLDRTGAWLHIADLQALMVLPDQAHELLILTHTLDSEVDDPEILAAAAAVEAALGASAAAPMSVQTWWQASPSTAQMLAMSDFSAYITLGIVFGAAGLGILNTMLMSVFERTRELGVMMALGTRPRHIIALVVVESALLASLACGVGLLVGLAFDYYLVTEGIPMTGESGERLSTAGVLFDTHIFGVVYPARIVTTLVGAVAVSILAAVWPATRASRLRPVDAMRGD